MQLSLLFASFYLLPKLYPCLNGEWSFGFIINSFWYLLIFLFLCACACSREKDIDVGTWGGDEERKVKAQLM